MLEKYKKMYDKALDYFTKVSNDGATKSAEYFRERDWQNH